VQEGHAIALKPLKDKSFTAEKARSQSFGEGDADFRSQGRAEERVFLTKQIAPISFMATGTIFPG
jgi:hypothetical protein